MQGTVPPWAPHHLTEAQSGTDMVLITLTLSATAVMIAFLHSIIAPGKR